MCESYMWNISPTIDGGTCLFSIECYCSVVKFTGYGTKAVKNMVN